MRGQLRGLGPLIAYESTSVVVWRLPDRQQPAKSRHSAFYSHCQKRSRLCEKHSLGPQLTVGAFVYGRSHNAVGGRHAITPCVRALTAGVARQVATAS
jgi:hypothetical protein